MTHKQKGASRINNDRKDRMKLKQTIETCVHPLKDLESPMCNIFSGEIAAVDVNVQIAFEKGKEMASNFRGTLPDGFFKPLSKRSPLLEKQMRSQLKLNQYH